MSISPQMMAAVDALVNWRTTKRRLSNDSSAPSLDAKTTDFISRSTKDLVLDVASGMGDDLYYLSALDTLATRIVVALDTFFPDDGSSFFSLVGRVDGAITGGFTLHVLLGTSYNNIDIATPRGIPRMALQKFILGKDYIQVTVERAHSIPPTRVHRVYVFEKTAISGAVLRINVYESASSWAIDVVKTFEVSAIMNMITRSHMIVMYPEITFAKVSLAMDNSHRDVISKYEARGFTFLKSNAHARQPCLNVCPALVRGVALPTTAICAPLHWKSMDTYPRIAPPWQFWQFPGGAGSCRNSACPNCQQVRLFSIRQPDTEATTNLLCKTQLETSDD